MQNTLSNPKGKMEKQLFLNPMIKKLSKINETSDEVTTYGGIIGKFGYFMLMIVVGIALAVVFKNVGAIGVDPETQEMLMSNYAIISILAAFGIFIVFPFLAFLIRKTIPVTGALYCVSLGYIMGFLMVFDPTYGSYMLLAAVLTFAIVAVMGLLYFKGYIHVTKKFRATATTLFYTMVLGGLAMLVCYFIPGLRESVMELQNNLVLSIGASLIGVVVATLFLLVDFDTVKNAVDNKLPRKYEWYAAFSILFTIVWLYFKILDLISKIQDAKN